MGKINKYKNSSADERPLLVSDVNDRLNSKREQENVCQACKCLKIPPVTAAGSNKIQQNQ